MTIPVMVVDDQVPTRMGLALMVDKAADCQVVAQAGNGREALDLLASRAAAHEPLPQVVLMDIRMPVMTGIEATGIISQTWPEVHVLALTTYDQDDYAFAMLGAGAAGFLLKDVRTQQLHDAIRAVADGDAILTPRITRALLSRAPGALLTPRQSAATSHRAELTARELAVAQLVARGLNNTEIAGELQIQPDSVKKNVTRILSKLGLRDRVQIAIVMRDGQDEVSRGQG